MDNINVLIAGIASHSVLLDGADGRPRASQSHARQKRDVPCGTQARCGRRGVR
jgi:hypothetical protein